MGELRLIPDNPFEEVKQPKVADRAQQAYLPVEVVERLIDAKADLEWKLLPAMARYLGVRVPSEPFCMTWYWVNRADRTLRIPSPRRRYTGKATAS